MSEEIWKPIEGYEGLYEVSNHGRVKSLKRKWHLTEHIRKPSITKKGYYYIVLTKNNVIKTFSVHGLVALHFIGPRTHEDINHKDGDSLNNHISNLEYCTRLQNIRHSCNMDKNTVKLNDSEINHIIFLLKSNLFYAREIAERFDVGINAIRRIRKLRVPELEIKRGWQITHL